MALARLDIELRALFEKLGSDMERATGIVESANKRIESVHKNFERVVQLAFAVTGVEAVKKFGEEFAELAEKGEKSGKVAENFKQLGGSAASIERAKKATLDMVGATELMTVANNAMVRGFRGVNEQLPLITEFSTRFAQANGKEVLPVVEELTNALVTGREKGLKPYIGTLDKDEAIIKFAEAHKKAGQSVLAFIKNMTDSQKAEAIRAVALDMLRQKMEALAPAQATVTTSLKRLETSWGDLGERVGEQLNNNPAVIKSFSDLGDTLDQIDGEEIAKGLNQIATAMAALGKAAKNTVDFVADTGEKLDTFKDRIDTLNARVKKFQDEGSAPGVALFKAMSQWYEDVPNLAAKAEKKTEDVAKAVTKVGEAAQDAGDKGEKGTGRTIAGLEGAAKAAQKAADEIKKLGDEWDKSVSDLLAKNLQQSIEGAIQLQDKGLFDQLATQFRDATSAGLDEQVAQFSQVVGPEMAEKWRQVMVDGAVMPFYDKFEEEGKKRIDELQKEQERAFKESADFWANTFRGLLDGHKIDFKSLLKDFEAGLLGSIVAAFTDGLAIKSAQELGIEAGKSILGSVSGGGGFGGIASTIFGSSGAAIGGSGASPYYGPGGGPAGQGAELGPAASGGPYALAAAAIAAAAYGVYDQSKKGNTLNATGLGLLAFGPMGAAAGFLGSKTLGHQTNPETQARKDLGGYLNDILSNSPLRLSSGGTLGGIDLGSSGQFNQPGWQNANIQKFGGANFNAFSAIGAQIAKMQGIAATAGPQIGKIIQDNLNGNLKDLGLLMDKLGISEQSVSDTFIQAAKDGDETWNEAIHKIRDLHAALQPGIEGVGNLSGAFKELQESGGRGVAALNAVKDSAQEAKEAGVKNFTEWQAKLAAVMGPDQANAFINALKQSGITKFSDIFGADDQKLGGIVSLMQDLGFKFTDVAKGAKDTADSVNAIDANTEKDITFNIKSNFDDNTQAAMDAGVFSGGNGAGITLPSGKLAKPATTVNTRSAVVTSRADARSMVIHVDARGAAPGVEHDVLRAMRSISQEEAQKAVSRMVDSRQRGGLRGAFG